MIWLPPARRTTRPQQQFVLADQGLSLTRGLVGAYILNAHSGLTIRDAARKANGTATAGVTWVTGREGLVSSMDASTSEVAFAAATGGVPAFTATKPISGAFRWKCTSAGNLTIACQFSLNGSGGWVLRINGGVAGTVDFFVTNANGNAGRQRNTSATFNDDKWHTGVFTYDGSNAVGGIHLYVDSPVEAAAATGFNTDPGAVTGGALSIGRLLGGAPQRFAGNLDFVFLWNRVLLPNEIAAILQNPWQILAPRKRSFFSLPKVQPVLIAGVGAFNLVSNAVNLKAQRRIGVEAGTFTTTGSNATPSVRRKVTADVGAFSLSGSAAAISQSFQIAAGVGAFTVIGNAAAMTGTMTIGPAVGDFTLGSNAAALRAIRRITPDTGAFVLNGADIGIGRAYLVAAEAGVFEIVRSDAALVASHIIAPSLGAFVLTGLVASTLATRLLVTSAGAYVLSGSDIAGNGVQRVLHAGTGMYVLTGISAVLSRDFRMVPTVGVFTLTGTAAELSYRQYLLSDFLATVPAYDKTATVLALLNTVTVPAYDNSVTVLAYANLATAPAIAAVVVPAYDNTAETGAANNTA